MKKPIATLSALAVAAVVAGTALAQNDIDPNIARAIKARQSQMTLYAFNLGVLGAMAKGEVEYDAETATRAAGNLAALSTLDQSRLWPKGSDNFEVGTEVTEALPKIWDADSDIGDKAKALADAAAAMNGAAGNGLDALRGAMGPLGKACGDCHKAYRQPDS